MILNIIFLVSGAWWFTNFAPLQAVIDRGGVIVALKTRGTLRELLNIIYEALGCPMCVGFWLALYFEGFLIACLVSLILHFLNLCLQKMK